MIKGKVEVNSSVFTLLLFLCCFLLQPSYGKEFGKKSLDGVFKPRIIKVTGNRIVIVDTKDFKIKIYDRDNMAQEVVFGGKGEGPGEYTTEPEITLLDKKVFVATQNKLLWFSYGGKLLEEMPNSRLLNGIIPLNNSWLGWKLSFKDKKIEVAYNLVDPQKKQMNLHSGPALFNRDRTVNLFEVFFYDRIADFFVIADRLEPNVMIFNSSGKLSKKIELEEKHIPFTEKHRRDVEALFLRTAKDKAVAMKQNKRRIYPKVFPAIMTARVDGENLYIITYRLNKNRFEAVKYNIDTGAKSKVYVPLEYEVPVSYLINPFSIYKQNLYQLIENPEDGEWYLVVEPLEDE